MKEEWTLARLRELIAGKTEEGPQLEYKAAGSFGTQNNQKVEITKDVSAMANSGGGIVIYGIAEKSHLPDKLDAIDRRKFSREWLEQVINGIQPRIDGLLIHCVEDDTQEGFGFYVVEVPQSNTAHQAKDSRYHKRQNFTVAAMQDYEIRDVMNRRKYPHIVLSFTLRRYTPRDPHGMPEFYSREKKEDKVSLAVYGENKGVLLAQYVIAKLDIPTRLLDDLTVIRSEHDIQNLPERITQTVTNEKQDYNGMGIPMGDKRREPLLPELKVYLGSVVLNLDALLTSKGDSLIYWKTHADDSPPVNGEVYLKDIPKINKSTE